ncbi:MAG: DUF2147 domain-containing protein [Bacteroidales bacterium]|nr:DUF2147 domain-containing protein [Bacteroidales bacterium]MBR5028011.1 DUF2147 domain-containing protein [Bacteroidales bacterium]
MKRLTVAMICLATLLGATTAKAQNKGDAIVGVFLMKTPDTGDESKVQIFRTAAGTYSGKVVWVKNPNNPDGTPRRDTKNPDPALRNRTADNLPVMKNLRYDADDNEWTDGDLYNPNEGKWYKIKIKGFSSANTLKVRYYKGIPLLGKDDTWKKVGK